MSDGITDVMKAGLVIRAMLELMDEIEDRKAEATSETEAEYFRSKVGDNIDSLRVRFSAMSFHRVIQGFKAVTLGHQSASDEGREFHQAIWSTPRNQSMRVDEAYVHAVRYLSQRI